MTTTPDTHTPTRYMKANLTHIIASTLLLAGTATVFAFIRFLPPWVGLTLAAFSILTTILMIRANSQRARAKQWRKQKPKGHEKREQWAEILKDMRNVQRDLKVPGNVQILQIKNVTPGDPFAAVYRNTPTHATLMVDEDFINLNRGHRIAITAHEIAHLQRPHSTAWKAILHRSRFPIAVLVTILAPTGFWVAAAAGTITWLTIKTLTAALSRREEKRADLIAYAYSGETYIEALTLAYGKHAKPTVDMWLTLEDTWLTHPTLPNRIKAMRGNQPSTNHPSRPSHY